MTARALSRPHLEATLVAVAVLRDDLRGELLERVDRLHASTSAVALLEQLADPAGDSWVHAGTAGQRELMERVQKITVEELCFWPLDVLISLVNQLPERQERQSTYDVGAERVA